MQDENNCTFVGTSLSCDTSSTSADEQSSSSSDSNDVDTFPEDLCECNLFSEINKTIMFEAANLTTHDVLMMVTGTCLRYNLSHSAQKAILELVNTLADPKCTDWNISNHISKLFSPPNDKVSYVFYCSKCYIELMEPITK